jgi:hypothetical protein
MPALAQEAGVMQDSLLDRGVTMAVCVRLDLGLLESTSRSLQHGRAPAESGVRHV